MTAAEIVAAEDALTQLDPKLGGLIKLQRPVERGTRDDYFAALSRAIIGQQISVAAAAAVYGRFEAATKLEPATVVAMSPEELRAVGLSGQKAKYLSDLAVHFVDDPAVYHHLDKASDDDVIAELTAVKGIGMWTAQMFLMFTLGRPDVFAPADIGLQRAMMRLYGWSEVPPVAELEATAERWRPYRTVASWHLWESLHNEPL